MSYTVEIKDIQKVTHDVKAYTFEKPEGYEFVPGQATEVSINKPEWKDEKRPFTFCSLNDDDYLQFVIKSYRDHDGVTNQLDQLKPGDELIIDDPWGAIHYDGPGTFLAGGAGVTPFIAIFRQLHKDGKVDGNHLYFSNKTAQDIILQEEFKKIMGDNFINTLTQEKKDGYLHGRIDKEFLEEHIDNFDQSFYICGPMQFVKDLIRDLRDLGVETSGLVFEK